MGPSFLFSRVVSILRIDEYLTLSFLMHGNLAVFHRLMKYVDPMAMAQVHPSIKTYSYKFAVGLKALLVEHLFMQSRRLMGAEM